MSGLDLFSLNQATVKNLSLPDVVDLCARHGFGGIGLWRDRIAETGAAKAAKLAHTAGLTVTSVCRGGFFTGPDADAHQTAIINNRAAIEETGEVGCRELVLVCGGMPAGSRDLAGARQQVADAIAELAPYAAQHGVRLAIEPMHPIFASDRSVITTLAQALDIAEQFPADQVGVVVDTYHVWWDPDIDLQIHRSGNRIASYQISDWRVPLPDDPETGNLLGRAHVGDGHINFDHLTEQVAAAGYRGLVEVEIFNADVWATAGDDVARTVANGFRSHLPQPLPWASAAGSRG